MEYGSCLNFKKGGNEKNISVKRKINQIKSLLTDIEIPELEQLKQTMPMN